MLYFSITNVLRYNVLNKFKTYFKNTFSDNFSNWLLFALSTVDFTATTTIVQIDAASTEAATSGAIDNHK